MCVMHFLCPCGQDGLLSFHVAGDGRRSLEQFATVNLV